jgi:pimeloyl-ACP methyl ester carboxylesterase
MQNSSKRSGNFARRAMRALLVLATLLIAAITFVWLWARPAKPDAFYNAETPFDAQPGHLIRLEPFSKKLPAGTQGWRLLYVTTRSNGSLAVASAVVFASKTSSASPRPVIAWAHGTTGIVSGCAPSVMADPFANVPAVERIAGEGWVYVAPDYVGLGTAGRHAYLVGDETARSMLDAVRAANAIPGLFVDRRMVVWGHSQGGHSALWTGIRARDHAPDIELLGVAAQAPASDLTALVMASKSSVFGKIVSAYVTQAYGATYPGLNVDDELHPFSKVIAQDIASRCVGDRTTLFSVGQTLLLPRDGIFRRDPTQGEFGARLSQNTPRGAISVPVFIAQGVHDDVVLPDIQRRYVAERCAAGLSILYREYDGLDHVSLVGRNSQLENDLVEWTRDRFAGRTTTDNCSK